MKIKEETAKELLGFMAERWHPVKFDKVPQPKIQGVASEPHPPNVPPPKSRGPGGKGTP